MAELKTKQNDGDVDRFLKSVTDEQKRGDSFRLLKLMESVTKQKATMWGKNIVGFGSYHYKYKSGREGDWFLTGFSPRKQNLTVYINPGLEPFGGLLEKLGKYKTGVGCLYIKKLVDIDMNVLEELIRQSTERLSVSPVK